MTRAAISSLRRIAAVPDTEDGKSGFSDSYNKIPMLICLVAYSTKMEEGLAIAA